MVCAVCSGHVGNRVATYGGECGKSDFPTDHCSVDPPAMQILDGAPAVRYVQPGFATVQTPVGHTGHPDGVRVSPPPEYQRAPPSPSSQTSHRQGGRNGSTWTICQRPAAGRRPKHSWSHVLAHDGQVRESVSCLPHPHFSTKGGLLYRVVEKEGGVTEQLVVRTSARCCLWNTRTS